MNEISETLTSSLLSSSDFQSFLAIIGMSADEYLEELGLDMGGFTSDKLKIKPTLKKVNSTTFLVSVTIDLEIPIKGKNTDKLGSIDINLTISSQSQILISPSIQMMDGAFCSVYLDFSQISKDDIDFTVKFDFEYELDDAEEHKFAVNTSSKIVHRATCHYITKIVDKEGKLKYLTESEMQKLLEQSDHSACKVCKPNESDFVGTDYRAYHDSKIIHRAHCIHIEDSNNKNFSLVSGYDEYIKLGYELCDWCKLSNVSEKNFEKKLLQDLQYADWDGIISEIKNWSDDSGYSGFLKSLAEGLGGKKSEKSVGIQLGTFNYIVAGIIDIDIDAYFVFNFDLQTMYAWHSNSLITSSNLSIWMYIMIMFRYRKKNLISLLESWKLKLASRLMPL